METSRITELNKLLAVIKSEYPQNHGYLISQSLRMSNIQLPTEEDQSAATPIEERPMALPKKRLAHETEAGSGSGKKHKIYRTNPYIDDEAACSDTTEDQEHDSVATPIEVPATSSKEVEATVTPTEAIRENMSLLESPLKLKAIRILSMPAMNENITQVQIDKYVEDIFFNFRAGRTYDILGKAIQYVGCFRFFCFFEESKSKERGLHKKYMQATTGSNYSKHLVRQLKAVGKRLNDLLKEFKYGALAIVVSYSVHNFERWSLEKLDNMVKALKRDQKLTKDLQDLKLHPTFLQKTGELNYVYYKDSE